MSASPPSIRGGVLPRILAEQCPPQWEFYYHTLPVVWGASSALDLSNYDLIVHLGLGVYDTYNKIILEDGAYNLRAGKDALGVPATAGGAASLRFGGDMVLSDETMSRNVAALDKTTQVTQVACCPPSPAPPSSATIAQSGQVFQIEAKKARARNSYLCNETHWRALESLQSSKAKNRRLQAVYFVHIPYPVPSGAARTSVPQGPPKENEPDFEPLGQAVAGVIRALGERLK